MNVGSWMEPWRAIEILEGGISLLSAVVFVPPSLHHQLTHPDQTESWARVESLQQGAMSSEALIKGESWKGGDRGHWTILPIAGGRVMGNMAPEEEAEQGYLSSFSHS